MKMTNDNYQMSLKHNITSSNGRYFGIPRLLKVVELFGKMNFHVENHLLIITLWNILSTIYVFSISLFESRYTG